MYAITKVAGADAIVLGYSGKLEQPWVLYKRYVNLVIAAVLFLNSLPSILSTDAPKATPAAVAASVTSASASKKKTQAAKKKK